VEDSEAEVAEVAEVRVPPQVAQKSGSSLFRGVRNLFRS